MALCHLPSITCTTHKLHRSFSSPFLTTSDDHHHHHLRWRALHRTGCRGGDAAATFVCSAKKPRARKKVKLPKPNMSDAELCSELREFVAREGLPGNHIPSMTELSKRGRKDLANIVRTKGYKVVTELLRNQTNEKILSERNEELLMNKTNDNIQSDRNEEILANQSNDKIQSERNEKLLTNKTIDKIQSERNEELLANQPNDKIQLERKEELLMNQTNDEIQSERGEELLTNHRNDEILSERNKELLWNQTSYDIQLTRNKELLRNQTKDKILSERNLIQNRDSANNKQEFSGPVILREATFVSLEQFSLRGNASANEASSRDDVDIISEIGKVDEETESSCLKTMLQQKEMELLLLKQEIENEKLALLALQKKANAEISNVQCIVSAKDSELRAAEEGLLGLKEVLIEYHAHGQSVEVTGSFNGWHHRVKMDHHSSSNAAGFSEIRESSRWTVTLWLYPGIYEIKFIVDGDWKIDSQREMLTRGHITNNILRVER